LISIEVLAKILVNRIKKNRCKLNVFCVGINRSTKAGVTIIKITRKEKIRTGIKIKFNKYESKKRIRKIVDMKIANEKKIRNNLPLIPKVL